MTVGDLPAVPLHDQPVLGGRPEQAGGVQGHGQPLHLFVIKTYKVFNVFSKKEILKIQDGSTKQCFGSGSFGLDPSHLVWIRIGLLSELRIHQKRLQIVSTSNNYFTTLFFFGQVFHNLKWKLRPFLEICINFCKSFLVY